MLNYTAYWLASTGTTVDLSPFLQYGIVGVVALIAMAVAATLYKRLLADYDKERERSQKLADELQKLNQLVQEQTMKALQDATTAVSEALEIVADIRSHRRRDDR